MANTNTDVEKISEERRDDAPSAGFAKEAPQGYRVIDIDPAVEKRVIKKLDRVVVTLVFLLCTLSIFPV